MICRIENIRYNAQFSLLQATSMFVVAVLSVFAIPLLTSQGFTAAEIGTLLAVKCAASIVLSPIYATLADRISGVVSNKIFICIFCLLGILITLVHLYVPLNFVGALFIFIGYGGSFSCIAPFADSLSGQYVSHGVQIHYAFARGMGSLFWAIAGLVLGILTGFFSFCTILWLQIFALTVCMIFTMAMKDPNKLQVVNEEENHKHGQKPSSLREMLRENPFYTMYLTAMLLLMTGVNMTMNYMAYTVEGAGGSNMDLGINGFVLGFSEVFVGIYFAFFLRKLGIRRLLFVAMLGMTLRVAMLTVATNMAMVYIAQLFEMIGCMLWAGNVQLVTEVIPLKDRIKGQTMIATIQSGISALVSSLLGGFIMEQTGDVKWLHSFALALCVMGVVVYVVYGKSKYKLNVASSITDKKPDTSSYHRS
ncbi:MAG: MFS transporter [Eubacteriales bacterium]|nr:MFS transporter [Eubacteriales bacterium]